MDREEVYSVNAAAERATDEIFDFHDRHGVDPLMSREQMKTHQQLLILNEQDQYEVDIVDERNRIHEQLRLRFTRRNRYAREES